jgi:hypothetical protein
MATVSRRDRLTDFAALALVLAGIALYLDASARIRTVLTYSYQHPGPSGRSAVMAVVWAGRESHAGLGLAVVGCLVGAVSAYTHLRRQRERRVS